MATDLRILSIRIDDQGNSVDWTKLQEVIVQKTQRNKIFFKTSHLEKSYSNITLKQRLQPQHQPKKLYSQPPKIGKDKYEDLMSLNESVLPVVRVSEYVDFYKSLPH
ncbi:hypothetical protein Pcinc_017924 [Petrolisthes cinctipes]|uniref:Uncharacterized protein n=1 Tax=Petrolisthes cinctipes TaxID=88211 RepID=A0AAE1FP56_PETCI|nr:hypothetical protein Pcinc_017924 [Petrolisthes cinctipes]